MWFPFYALLREVPSCGFHFSQRSISMWFPFFAVKYLHVVSTLLLRLVSWYGSHFSPWSISKWFPFFTQFFVPKNGVAVFKLNWQRCNLCY
jgi:hypothetical protein